MFHCFHAYYNFSFASNAFNNITNCFYNILLLNYLTYNRRNNISRSQYSPPTIKKGGSSTVRLPITFFNHYSLKNSMNCKKKYCTHCQHMQLHTHRSVVNWRKDWSATWQFDSSPDQGSKFFLVTEPVTILL